MICVKITGGLGNQLFQYSFGRAIAEMHKEELYLDISDYSVSGNIRKFELPKFKNCRYNIVPSYKIAGMLYFRYPGNKYLLFSLFNRFFKKVKKIQENSDREFLDSYERNFMYYYNGYWQSEKYFKLIEKLIRVELELDFTPETKIVELFKESRTIVIQIRRGDYLLYAKDEAGRDVVLPVSFYKKALEQIDDFKEYNILIISDESERIKQEWVDLPANAVISSNDHYTDFWMIMNADIAIISNSSFGWWGAYLNKKKDKKILIPEYWFGIHEARWVPSDINVEGWKTIQVEI